MLLNHLLNSISAIIHRNFHVIDTILQWPPNYQQEFLAANFWMWPMSPNCTILIFNWQHFTLIYSFSPNSFSFSFLYKQILLPHLLLEVTRWFDDWFVIRTLLLTWKRIKSSHLRIFTQMNTNRSIGMDELTSSFALIEDCFWRSFKVRSHQRTDKIHNWQFICLAFGFEKI